MRTRDFAATFAVAAKRVSFCVGLVLALVFNFGLVACDPAENGVMETTSVDEVKKPHKDDPVTPDPSLDWSFGYTNYNHGWNLTTNWWVRETYTQFNDAGVSRNAVSHKDDRYAVASVSVNLQETQERTFAGQLSTKTVENSMIRKVYEDGRRWTAPVLGNLCYFDAEDQRVEAEVRDTLRKLPCVVTVDAKVKAVNLLPGTTKYQTRGTYVSDSTCVEVVWEAEKEVVGNGLVEGGERFNVELRDTFKVLLLSEDDIARGYIRDKNRVPLDDITERCSFTEVLVMKSGEEHENPRNYILNRKVQGIDEYLKTVTSFGYSWRYDNALSLGNVSKNIRKENNWTVDGRTDSFSALINNGAEPINTSYTYYHEGCTYKDEWVEVEFPLITPVMKEFNTRVESIESDDEAYDQARLFNTVSTEYLGWNQNVGETVKLQMKKDIPTPVTITDEGWDYTKSREIIYNDSIAWIPVYYIEYSDGTRVENIFRFSDDRLLEKLTNWTSIENNETQSTGNVAVTKTATRDMTAAVNGAVASWTRESYSLANNAQLAGSTQENRWRSIEPNGMTVKYRGKEFTFTRHSISTTNAASVTGGGVVGDYKVYDYKDDLAYSFGDNTKHSVAPGTIKVPAVSIVSEGWDNSSAREVWSNNRVDWSLDWVVKFSDGTEDRTSFAANDSRTFTVDTDWNKIQANANYSTSSYVVNVTESSNQSKTVNGAVFNWVRETRKITTTVTLASGTATNGWTAVDPFSCKVTYKGKTYDFGRKSISFSHQDNLSGGQEVDGYKVYNYGDNMSYTVAGNTKSLTAPGKIRVKVEVEPDTFFPKEWGALVEVKQTVANNEAHDSFVYTWSLRFKNNIVLPVVIRPGATKPEWKNFAYAEFTTVTAYNGGTYEAASNTWVNTTAKDQTNHMVWSREGAERANKNYSEAKMENWDEGHWPNNRPSVKTSRYDLTISDGNLIARDTYTGAYMGTWSYYNK